MKLKVEDLPNPLWTYSTYFDTLSVCYALDSHGKDAYARRLSDLLGKNVASVSHQIKGSLQEYKLLDVEKKGLRKIVVLHIESLCEYFIHFAYDKMKDRALRHNEIQIKSQGKFEEYSKHSAYDRMEDRDLPIKKIQITSKSNEWMILKKTTVSPQNQYLQKVITKSITVYGRDLIREGGGRRGYFSELVFSLEDFFYFMLENFKVISNSIESNDENAEYEVFKTFRRGIILWEGTNPERLLSKRIARYDSD